MMRDKQTGFLVKEGNSEDIIEKLRLIFEDSSSAQEMGKEGRKSGGTKTKAAFGRAGSAVGRGAGAVKSGIGRGTSRVVGIFKKGDKEGKPKSKKRGRPAKKKTDYSSMKLAELKAELKKKDLATSGNKAELIKRLQK